MKKTALPIALAVVTVAAVAALVAPLVFASPAATAVPAAKVAGRPAVLAVAKSPAPRSADITAKPVVTAAASVQSAPAVAGYRGGWSRTRTTSRTSAAGEAATARSILASLQAKYRYLDGVTVSMGTTPGGYQAVAYYTAGRIVVSTKHTASLDRILKHEIWHIIDYRDNGRIDWRESVPPKNAASYLK